MRHLSWLISIPLSAVAISFAVSNLTPVQLQLWPFIGSIEVPAFTLVLVTLVLAFFAGGITVWVGQHGHRKAERLHQARADRVQKELDDLRGSLRPVAPPVEITPKR